MDRLMLPSASIRRTLSRSLAAVLLTAAVVTVGSVGGTAVQVHAEGGRPGPPAEVIVKIDLSNGHTVQEVTARFPVKVQNTVLASRGILLLISTSSEFQGEHGSKKLAFRIGRSPAVIYAEPNNPTTLDYDHYHAWPAGTAHDVGTDRTAWTEQAAVTTLRLAEARKRSTGRGVVVAVLDTGVDAGHPVLAGHLRPGWDYVDDDADASEVGDGIDGDGEAFGHGTFVAGVVSLVAPDVKIVPLRVLDSDGEGDVFLVAQAILDAVDAGAQVINLSLGSKGQQASQVLAEACAYAEAHGVAVVAAAGNQASDAPRYPAAIRGVLGVTALNPSTDRLTWFANYGRWIDVAAPGTKVVGPYPGARYVNWAGSSMATAFVSGQVALLRASFPGVRLARALDAIRDTARYIDKHQVAYGGIDPLASLEQLD